MNNTKTTHALFQRAFGQSFGTGVCVWKVTTRCGLVMLVSGPREYEQLLPFLCRSATERGRKIATLSLATDEDLRAQFACGLEVVCV